MGNFVGRTGNFLDTLNPPEFHARKVGDFLHNLNPLPIIYICILCKVGPFYLLY